MRKLGSGEPVYRPARTGPGAGSGEAAGSPPAGPGEREDQDHEPEPDDGPAASFEAWAASFALYDYPLIADGGSERVCIRAGEARALLARAHRAGWDHARGIAPEHTENSL